MALLMRVFSSLIRLALLVILPSSLTVGALQHPADSAPEPVQWQPDIVRDSLANGLQIYFTRVNDVPLAEISIVVDAGLLREQGALPGTAYLTNQMLLEGSADRSGDMISRRMDQLGSILLPYAHYDYAQLYGKMLAKNFRSTLELMADAVIRPTFPALAIDVFRQRASTAPRLASSHGQRASATAVAQLCGSEHPMTRPLLPEEGDLAALTREDLVAFHEQCYRPGATSIIITGNLDYRFVRTLLVEAFGRWKEGAMPAGIERGGGATDGVIMIADTATPKGLSYVRIAAPIPDRKDGRVPALVVMNNILSDGASSRLRHAMWGERTISPSFTSAIGFSRYCSYLMITGSVSPALVDTVLRAVELVGDRLSGELVDEKELADAKTRLLADSPLTFASNRSLQSLLKEAAVYDLEMSQVLNFSRRVKDVKAEDVRAIAREVFNPNGLHIVLLGDAGKMQPRLRAMGLDVDVRED